MRALAVGAFALGAGAIRAIAVGAMAIGRLRILEARVEKLLHRHTHSGPSERALPIVLARLPQCDSSGEDHGLLFSIKEELPTKRELYQMAWIETRTGHPWERPFIRPCADSVW